MFPSVNIENKWSKLHGTKENEWNANDDVDEMNIGETKTEFKIHGIADC